MNDVQRILWDMQGPVYEEISRLESMVINQYQQASLGRLQKIEQLIKVAWEVSEVEDKDHEQELRKLKQTLFALSKDVIAE
jgi:hypothetical protein